MVEDLDKKRLRDRRAQNARRVRQEPRIRELEKAVLYCKEHHSDQQDEDVRNLRTAIEVLRLENDHLRHRQAAAVELLKDCRQSQAERQADLSNILNQDSHEPQSWSQRPKYIPHGFWVEYLTPWMLCPAVILRSPDLPGGPDLLYGSIDNALANSIQVATTCAHVGRVREPERLAIGWVMYVLAKWLVEPTPEHYKLLPSYIRPTKLQLMVEHSVLLNYIPWPVMRDNMLKAYKDDPEGSDLVTALKMCNPHLKESAWTAHKPMLEPSKTKPGRLKVRTDFYEAFAELDSWTVKPEFIERYPDLCKGTPFEVACSSGSV